MQIFYLCCDSLCACSTLMVRAKFLSHPCRMIAEYVIEICSAGEQFPSSDPGRDSNLTRHVNVYGEKKSCTCVHTHPNWFRFSKSAPKIAPLSLQCALLSCRLWFFPLWQPRTHRSVCFLKSACNVMWSIGYRVSETLQSLPWCCVGWEENS